jgi:hypothetical protein
VDRLTDRARHPKYATPRGSNDDVVTTVVRPWFGRGTSNLARKCDPPARTGPRSRSLAECQGSSCPVQSRLEDK